MYSLSIYFIHNNTTYPSIPALPQKQEKLYQRKIKVFKNQVQLGKEKNKPYMIYPRKQNLW